MDRDGDGFKFLKDFFGAEKTDAKLKAGVFVGLEIRKLMQNEVWWTIESIRIGCLECHKISSCQLLGKASS